MSRLTRSSDLGHGHACVGEQPKRDVVGRLHWGPRYLLGGAFAVSVFLMFLAGEVATVSAQSVVPSAPTGLSGTLRDGDSVALDWADTSGATSYQLSYRHFHVSAWVDLPVTGVTVTMTGSQAVVSGLPSPVNYYFRVRASNSEGSSDWSEEALVTPAPTVGVDGCTIEAPPAPLARFDKYCSAGGVGVVGSEAVSDFAIKLAWNQIMNMLAAHPTVRQRMAQAGAHHQVDAASESPQSPRYRSTTRHSRAPEANLLCYLDSFPYNYSFLVHEFAHAIYDAGLPDAERQEVTAAYNAAMEAGLWENKYARNSDKEYWAEAVEAYFSGATRGINFNHEEMAEHDARIYEVLLRYLPANGWRVSCPHSSEAPPPPAKPPAPVNLRATTVTQTNVTLTWEVPPGEEGNVQRYHIVRSDDEVQSWWVIATIPADRTTFAVTGLTPDYLYSFAIRAGNGYRETIGPWEGVRTSPSVYRLSGETDIMRSEHSGPFVAHYTAPDLDAATLSFSLAGADAGRFEMSGGGQLSFRVAPDYESPADADRDNVYNVTVQARDGSHAISLDVTVMVTDINEPPAITGNATPSVAENTIAVVATYGAMDPEGVTPTWSLQGRPGVFTISSAGALAFTNPPNYEAQTQHTVTVSASDGVNATDHVVTVTVTDVDETEELTLSKLRPLIGIDYTAAFKEGTGDVVQSPTWAWQRSMSRSGRGTDIMGATAATYSPVADDRNHYLRVTASYNDGHGQGTKTLSATSEFATAATSASNTPPTFPSPLFTGGQTGPSVRENAGVRTVVGVAPQATDMQGGTLSYSLAVDGFTSDPPFEINPTSRQIRVAPGARLNHEGQGTYGVTVTVVDEFNATATATFDITIDDVNERPVAVPDPAVTTEEDTAVTFAVLTNDTDPDEGDTLTVSITTQPRPGRVVLDTNTQMLTYEPADNVFGTFTFTYTATDDDPVRRLSSLATLVTVTVTPVNDPPEFATDMTTRTVSEGAGPGDTVGTKLAATDVDDITLTYSLAGASDFVIDATGQIQVAPGITLDREHTSSYEVTVTADDGKGGTDSITVTITVTDVNEPPTAVNDTATTAEDQSVNIDVLANDTDPDTEKANLMVSVRTQPLNGRARVESDRTITYTPNANFAGENSFTYRLSDGQFTDDGSVSVTVVAVNDAPTFFPTTAARSVPEDAEAGDNVGPPVTATDVDNAMLTYSLSGTGASSFEIDSNGQIRVKTLGALDHETAPTHTVTVEASDNLNASDTVQVTITVTDVNEPPTAVNDTATTAEDQSVNIDVLANDTDPDTEKANLMVSVRTQPLNGRARAQSDRTITYTPNANFAGENSFTYRLSDGQFTDDGSVSVTVVAVNDAPTFFPTTAARSVPEDAEAGDNVGPPVTATDVDNAMLTYSLSGTGASSFEIDSNDQIRVKTLGALDHETAPTHTVTVEASDNLNASDTVQVTITVTDVNEPPTAVNHTKTTAEDTSTSIEVLADDTDPDTEKANLRVSVLRQPRNGTARVENDQTITYTPNANFADPDPFTYRVSDGSLADDGLITVTVTEVNDAPTFLSPTAARSVPEDAVGGALVVPAVTAKEVDEHDTLTYRLSGADASSFVIDNNGQITVAAGITFDIAGQEIYTVTVEADDSRGGMATVEVTITVGGAAYIPPSSGGGGGGGGAASQAVAAEAAVVAAAAPARAWSSSSGP